jgi:hypothetical protein
MSVDSDRGGQAPPQTSELWQPPNLGKPASEILRLDPRSKRWTFAGLKALLGPPRDVYPVRTVAVDALIDLGENPQEVRSKAKEP